MGASLELTPDELLTTTRAVRKRLDLERPVPRELLVECLEIAVQAPTGSNLQNWHFLLVDDPAKKRALADIYGRAFDPYAAAPAPEHGDGDSRDERRDRVKSSATYLREHFHEVPWMLIPCAEGRIRGDVPVLHASYWGSLLPAVWNFMLAARARSLGTAWTTLHLMFEEEAAGVLGIPFGTVTQGGLIPVAYTKGTDFKPAPRIPLDSVVHWNQW